MSSVWLLSQRAQTGLRVKVNAFYSKCAQETPASAVSQPKDGAIHSWQAVEIIKPPLYKL